MVFAASLAAAVGALPIPGARCFASTAPGHAEPCTLHAPARASPFNNLSHLPLPPLMTSHFPVSPPPQLDILAGHRSGSGEVGGTLLVNGRAMASEAFQRLSCYVLQRDVLLASRCGVGWDGAVCVCSATVCVCECGWGGGS